MTMSHVTNFYSNSVSIINTSNDTVVGSPISVDVYPSGIAYDPIHKRMYVANLNGNDVSVIDTTTNTLINTLTGFNGPIAVKFNPINQNMYFSRYIYSYIVSTYRYNMDNSY